MCRMILARGRFPAAAVVEAARAMSEGRTARHDGPITRHPNGWGAVWAGPGGELRVHRDPRPMTPRSLADLPGAKGTRFLVVHVRHATLPKNQGVEFTHPVTRPGTEVPWYLLHNGFLPTVYRRLGRDRSVFDSGEYFDYVVPPRGDRLDPHAVLSRLAAIEPGGTSANAILVNPRRAYLIHYTQPGVPFTRYFTMSSARTAEADYYASEEIPALAGGWAPLAPGQVIEIDAPRAERVPHKRECNGHDASLA